MTIYICCKVRISKYLQLFIHSDISKQYGTSWFYLRQPSLAVDLL